MNNIVMLQRIIEQERAPIRPGIRGARGAQDAEAIGGHLTFAQYQLRREPAVVDLIVDIIGVSQMHVVLGKGRKRSWSSGQ